MDQLWLFVAKYDGLEKVAKPVTDNDFLQNAQYEWLRNGDKNAYAEMWLRSIKICRKLIYKEMEKKKFYIPKEEVEDKAVDAVEYVFRQYDRHFNFTISKFAGALYFGVSHALYYQTLGEKAFSKAIKLMNEQPGITLEQAFALAKEKLELEQHKKIMKIADEDDKFQLELEWF